MKTSSFSTFRLVKSEDLNHHGTLYAGRSAEWFVESGFVSASSLLHPKSIICMQIHGMTFSNPIRPGQTICYTSKIVYSGKSSLVSYIKVNRADDMTKIVVDGFITFIHVDEETKPKPHGIIIEPVTPEDEELFNRAMKLKK